VFKHPAGATSWQLACVREVMAMPGVSLAAANVCACGAMQVDSEGPGLISEPVRFVSNTAAAIEALGNRCSGGRRCIPLRNRRAKAA
jgi:hypothetical protein